MTVDIAALGGIKRQQTIVPTVASVIRRYKQRDDGFVTMWIRSP